MKRFKTMKWAMPVLVFICCICPFFGIKVNAQTTIKYDVKEENGILSCTYKDTIQKDKYFSLKKSGNVYTVVKPCTKNSKVYYFDANGDGKAYTESKFIKVTYQNSTATYYSKKGVLLTNTIAGNKKQGYWYVDKTGVKVTAKEIKQAVKFVRAHTKSSWSKSKKLKACYQYLWKNYTYQRFYEKTSASKIPSYARYMFSKKRGNCYRYAASFAYIARVLGYDSRVTDGSISRLNGNGMTPHSWTEVKVGGKWYICDANMQRNFPSVDSYMKTKKTYGYKHNCSKRYTMTIKNGKVSWK